MQGNMKGGKKEGMKGGMKGDVGVRRATTVHVNCMALSDPKRIFGHVLSKAYPKHCRSPRHETDPAFALAELRRAVGRGATDGEGRRAMVVLILDEVDSLFSSDGSVLYDLFALAEINQSNLIFIGIANSIDLTLRMLPHLHTIGCEPFMVNFRAYRHDELHALLDERLSVLPGPVFDAKALELGCRKLAASSGDMRQCLHVAYAALEAHAAQWGACPTGAPHAAARGPAATAAAGKDGGKDGGKGVGKGAGSGAGSGAGACEGHRVDLQQMALALGKCLKLPLINGIRALPQHQQMILCAATFLEDTNTTQAPSSSGPPSLPTLFSKYADLCARTKLRGLAFHEFGNACMALDDQGLVKVCALGKGKGKGRGVVGMGGMGGRGGRGGRGAGRGVGLHAKAARLKVKRADVTFALQGSRFFHKLLSEGA